MRIRFNLLTSVFLFFNCLHQSTYASPWFTGPLLAPSGHTIPPQHLNFETYLNDVRNIGTFNRHWKLIHTPRSDSIQINPILTYGLFKGIDTQFSVPYSENRVRGRKDHTLGDFSAILGFQALEQKKTSWPPDLRITIQEIFPTGNYDGLSPGKLGTDGSGQGSYQTALAFNFQHLSTVQGYNLRNRLSINLLHASQVRLHGLSTYGGSVQTRGTIRPGDLFSIDLASELGLTQNLVAVMEGLYSYRQATRFHGFRGVDEQGNPANIGHGSVAEFSLAPAVEYNFSAHLGLIAGVWFAVKGRDASDFITSMIALNTYW